MKKHTRVWLGISLTSVLMTGTSLGGIYFYAENFEPPLYHEKYIVIDGDTLSRDVFAENIEENNEVWFYRNPKSGKLINLNELSDYRIRGDRRHNLIQNLQMKKHIDTIMVK
ncbi:MAG: hypothetical protein IJW72_06090, partial [Alphaproteobacteria bacterium]|nr:hypothetical protein [Alphaproteobacteria bacterium]